MKLSKSEFKILLGRMNNSDRNSIKKYIKNISNTGHSGDSTIDRIINSYSPNYIYRIMNKINNRILVGGSETESENNPLAISDTEKTPKMDSITIVDNKAGLSATSSEMPEPVSESKLSETSSEMPFLQNPRAEPIGLSATSSEMPGSVSESKLSETSEIFISNQPAKKEEMIVTTTEIPPTETKKSDDIKTVLSKLREKSRLLEEKERYLNNREAELKRLEQELSGKRESVNNEVEAQRSRWGEERRNIEENISKLQQEKQLLTDSVSDLKSEREVINSDLNSLLKQLTSETEQLGGLFVPRIRDI